MAYNAPTGDFVTSTLSGALTAIADSATIGTGLTLPATNGILQIDYDSTEAIGAANGPETISYAAYNSGTGALTGIVRGLTNTTGVTHLDGASVQCGMSSQYYGNGVIQNTDLSTSAITLGYTQIVSNFTTNTTGSLVDVTNLNVAVTVPAGGRRLKLTAYISSMQVNDAAAIMMVAIQEGTTILQKNAIAEYTGNAPAGFCCVASFVPTAGAHTYKVTVQKSAGTTLTVNADATYPAFILAELI